MFNRTLFRATQRLLLPIYQFAKNLIRSLVLWLLRGLLLIGRQPKPVRGFVLPTTILLLLLLTLTVGAITLRTYNRTTQAIGERQQRVIYNAATPAIDRAKAKLEYLFDSSRDPRFPSGIPPQGKLQAMLRNDGVDEGQHFLLDDADEPFDPYTFPDEERLDLDGDDVLDNAWKFRSDIQGDGLDLNEEDASVAYSIIMSRPPFLGDNDPLANQGDGAIAGRAEALQVRHAPLSLGSSNNPACNLNDENDSVGVGAGWFVDPIKSSLLLKNFQVDVYVLPDNNNGTVSTLEFQQDRQMLQGNKWGAWFRNDLEIFPGPRFNWNGAMHTEGNLIVGGDDFRGFLISSPNSCLYEATASEVSIALMNENNAGRENGGILFEGQFISGITDVEDDAPESYFHIHANVPIAEADYGQGGANPGPTQLLPGSDSIPNDGPDVIDYTLDPIVLATQDISKARNIDAPDTPQDFREGAWDDRDLSKTRLINQSEETPIVDDAFRADNRYGPKPRIGKRNIPGNIGTPITGELLNDNEDEDGNAVDPLPDLAMIRGDAPADDDQGTNLGLDGYWDRRARNQGMRILVSPRLELGNAHGWGGGIRPDNGTYRKDIEQEPLMPWDSCDVNANNADRCHEARQRRALSDNLAAVQATAFYHASQTGATPAQRDFPAACMVSAVHPGTPETLILSSTFKDLKENLGDFLPAAGLYSPDGPPVLSNFFLGTGTNGWEYEAAPSSISTENQFGTAVESDESPLGKALRNLAYFAGDPKGGAPSFEPVDNTAEDEVHPYPWLSMWGDFSVLRRVLAEVDGLSADEGNPFAGTSVPYGGLSPADKATLHASACMIGMLAYNVGFYEAIDYSGAAATALMATLETRIGELNSGAVPAGVRAVNLDESVEGYIAGLKQWNQVDDVAVPPQMVALAEAIALKEQIARDRRNGFYGDDRPQVIAGSDPLVAYDNIRDHLAGDDKTVVKFPALKYIFPGDIADAAGATNGADGIVDDLDTFEEEVVDDDIGGYDYDDLEVRDSYIEDINSSIEFRSIDLSDPVVLDDLAIVPKDAVGDWVLPHNGAGTGNTTLSNAPEGVLIGCLSDGLCTNDPGADTMALEEVGFKDTALFNGREMMPVRALDVNLDLIRGLGAGLTDDTWLPKVGIIYAFREDAVREDMITRPASGTWADCGQDAVFAGGGDATCLMNAGSVDAFDSTDPPLNDANRISPKAVDYSPDPDRRPYGFRLRNGEVLERADDQGRGMSFITDDPVYLQGDFNLHRDPGGDILEEFDDQLNRDTFANFYSRANLDENFARPGEDLWRPSEILSDAITILSNEFCDGSAEDITRTVAEPGAPDGGGATLPALMVADAYGCEGSGNKTSYLTMNRLSDDVDLVTTVVDKDARFLHADPYDLLFYEDDVDYDDNSYTAQWETRVLNNTPTTPVAWSRNGNPVDAQPNEYQGGYYVFADDKPLIDAGEAEVNAIIISGLIPSRQNQSYGGLHNFPRFVEYWSGTNLFFSGSLLQLSFSQYATAPYSQKAWEPGQEPGTDNPIQYYNAPRRRWGYDVGLQYAPAGPLAERFVNAEGNPKSEFYSEPPADDPYMITLCRVIAENPDTTCAQ
ncbi:MAG: hormogonium polysaccharide biosynthesis protein HpsA [Elainellaceae cyanobacterium]